VVANVIGAAASTEQLRKLAPLTAPQQRPAMRAVFEKIPEVRTKSPTIDQIFVPVPPSEQKKDADRTETIRQRVTEQKKETNESIQRNGPPSICK
jgi:hypothetical protein